MLPLALAALVVLALVLYAIRPDPAPEEEVSFDPDLPFPGYGESLSGPGWPTVGPGTVDPVTAGLPRAGPRDDGQWDNQIVYVCALYNMADPLAPLLMKAIIEHESAHTWNPRICGDAFPGRCTFYRGDPSMVVGGVPCCSIGLMQVYRTAHPDLAARYDLRDGNQNILAGGQVLAGAYRLHWPDWDEVLQTYNGGTTRNAQTANYARAVGGTFRRLASAAGVAV